MRTLTCDECGDTFSGHHPPGWRETTVYGIRPPGDERPATVQRLDFCSLICEETWCGRERERVGDEAAPASAWRYWDEPAGESVAARLTAEEKVDPLRCPSWFRNSRCVRDAGHEGRHEGQTLSDLFWDTANQSGQRD